VLVTIVEYETLDLSLMPNSQPKIYKSLLPPVPVECSSIFTFLFEQTYYEHDPSAAAFIDFKTGQQTTREEVKNLSLRLAWGLRNTIRLPNSSPGLPDNHLDRGDVVMLVSPNSLSWPLALFGCAHVLISVNFLNDRLRSRFSRCVAAGLKITLAAYSSTPRELSWQYLDIKPRAIFVARHLVPVVEQMFSLIGSSPEEAKRRIRIMDTLSDLVSLEGFGANGTLLMEHESSGVNGLHQLVGKEALEREELFDNEDAEESVYICYSSGTTVSQDDPLSMD
jgi:acyl-CoA synthetase (AMP-forming)/AMP-acid ligase II